MTNAADKNEIIAYQRSVDGSLQQDRSFRTDGRGSGGVTDPLGSQGSLTLSEDHSLLFAVNAGSGSNAGASSLAISPDGQFVLVTEKLTHSIDAFRVRTNGTLAPIVVNPSVGPRLFSVLFAPNGTALATETGPAGGSNASAISSYAVHSGGTLSAISASVPTSGAATCWHAITPDGHFVFTSNAGSATISGFVIVRTDP